MEARDNHVLEIRGEALGTITNQSSIEEIFQNKTCLETCLDPMTPWTPEF